MFIMGDMADFEEVIHGVANHCERDNDCYHQNTPGIPRLKHLQNKQSNITRSEVQLRRF